MAAEVGKLIDFPMWAQKRLELYVADNCDLLPGWLPVVIRMVFDVMKGKITKDDQLYILDNWIDRERVRLWEARRPEREEIQRLVEEIAAQYEEPEPDPPHEDDPEWENAFRKEMEEIHET